MKLSRNGFSLIETLLTVALIGVLVAGVISFQSLHVRVAQNEKLKENLSGLKAHLLQTISSDAAWAKTVAMSSASSGLGCIGSSAGCGGVSTGAEIDVYEADGTLVFSSKRGAGFNSNGSACEGGGDLTGSQGAAGNTCPVRLKLTWTPICSASDTNCKYPLIQISGQYSVTTGLPAPLNLSKHSFIINRSPLQATLCPDAAPSCSGSIPVCTAGGWTCVAPLSPYCQGAVSWKDSATNDGLCSATFPAPGVLHHTLASIANTAGGYTGNANFQCNPGQPNNGFILQTGATCSAAGPPGCPAGTSLTGLGGESSTAGCFCNANNTGWNGSACVAPNCFLANCVSPTNFSVSVFDGAGCTVSPTGKTGLALLYETVTGGNTFSGALCKRLPAPAGNLGWANLSGTGGCGVASGVNSTGRCP